VTLSTSLQKSDAIKISKATYKVIPKCWM